MLMAFAFGKCRSVRRRATPSMAFGSILPFAPGNSNTLLPFAKNSGAPHSAVSMCACSWHKMLLYDWQIAASDSEFAAVPLNTKNTSHFVSNRSRIMSAARAVHSSLP